MAIDLQELRFKVVTDDLDTAIQKVGELGKAVQSINTPVNNLTKNTKEASNSVDKLAKVADATAKATKTVADSGDKAADKLSKLKDQLSFLRNDLNISETGFTKAQAGVMAWAKSVGAGQDILKEFGSVFDNFNRIMGEQALDKSVAGFNMLNRQLKEFQLTSELAAKGANLTSTQIKQLSRDIEVARQQNISLGRSADSGVEQLKKNYIQAANSVNQYVAAAKEQERVAKVQASSTINAAKASAYLEEETKKLVFTNQMLERGFTSASANTLYKHKTALEATGKSANEVRQSLYLLEQELVKKQGTSPFSKLREDVQKTNLAVNHLARNISVQMTDIWVSLANGQGIFQVVTQQFGQIADAFSLAGVNGKDMSGQLINGAKMIFSSWMTVFSAFGGLGLKAIKGLGDAISGFVMKTTGANLALDMFRRNAAASGEAGFALIGTINRIAASASILAGVVGSLAILLGGAFLLALYKVNKEQDALTKQMILTGGSMAMSSDSAIKYAMSMNQVGISTSDAIGVMALMAKEGGFVAKDIEMIGVSATQMSKYFDISIEDTVKAFKKLKDEPSKALVEIAKSTGLVKEETIKLVMELENQGRSSEAAGVAMKAYADVQVEQVKRIKEEYSTFGLFFINLGDMLGRFWKGIKDIAHDAIYTSPTKVLENNIQKIKNEIADIENNRDFNAKLGISFDPKLLNQKKEELRIALAQLSTEVRINGERERQLGLNTQAATRAANDNAMQLSLMSDIEKKANEILRIKSQIESGTLSESIGLAKIAKLNQEIVDLNKPKIDGQKKTNDLVDAYSQSMISALKQYSDLVDLSIGFNKDFSEKEAALNLLLENKVLTQGQYNEAYAALLKQQPIYKKGLESEQKLYEQQLKALESLMDFREKIKDDQIKNQQAIDQETKSLDLRFELLGKTEQEAKLIQRQYETNAKIAAVENKYIAIRKNLLQEYNKAVLDGANDQEAFKLYNDAMKEAGKQQGEELKNIHREVAYQAAEDYQKAFDEIQSTVSDIIATALFEGGKAGQKKLKDVLKNAFKNFVINVVINPITQGITTSLSRSFGSTSSSVSGTGTGQGFDFGGSIVSGVNNIGSFLYNNGQGLFGSDMLASLGSSIQGFSYDVAGFSDAIGSFGGYLNAFNLALDGNYGSAAGAAIGTYIMPGIGTVVGEWLGSFADGLFGNAGTPHTGGVGSYSAAQGALTGRAADQWVNFDPNKRASAWNGDANQSAATIAQITATMLDGFAQSFGQQTGYLVGTGFQDDSSSDGAWGALKIALGDQVLLDWGRGRDKWPGREFANGQAGQEGYLTALATDVRSVMMDIAPDWADDILNALGDAPTMDQLTTALAEIQKILFVFDNLGSAMSQLSNISDDAQGALMRAAGGIDNLTSLVSNYYDQYYSESEKLSFQTEKLKAQFEALGLEMPTSREGFRVLVESMNLSTQSGRETYIALLGLADAFASITPAIEDFTANIQDLISSLTSSYSSMADLESQIAAKEAELARQAQLDSLKSQQDALNEQLKTVQGLLQAARSLRTYVQSLKLGQLSSLTTQQKLDEFSSLYQKQLQAAKSGDITAFSDIQGTTSGFLEAYKSQAVTSTDYARQFMKMTNELDALGKTTEDVNASIEVELLNKLKDIDSEISSLSTTADNSLAQLKAQLDQAKKQFIQDLANTTQQVIATDNVADVLGQLPPDLAAILSTSLANTLNPLFNSLASAITAGTSVKASSSAISSAIGSASTGTNTIAGSQADLVKNIVTSALPDTSYSYTDKAQLVTNLMNQGYTGSSITQMMVDTYGVSVQSEMDKLTQAAAINDIYNTVFGRTADQSGLDYWTNQLNTGAVSTSNIVNAIIGGAQNQDITNTNLSTLSGYIPKFADGGSYLGGLALVGEEGPELINFNQPGQVYTANQTSNLMQSGNSALLEELRSLREEVVMLRAETRATVSNTSKTAKILDRVVRGEDTVNTVVVA